MSGEWIDNINVIRDLLERNGWAPAPVIEAPDEEPIRPVEFSASVAIRPEPGTSPPEITYFTPLEIATATPDGTAWVTRGYWAFGAITELDGKIKSAGKTTLLLDAARCMRAGLEFLGQPTTACKVVYVTEQAPGPFREALERAGLLGCGDGLRVVFRRDIAHLGWRELVTTVAVDAAAMGTAW